MRSSWNKYIDLIQDALYETLYLCAKDSRVQPWWFVLTILVDFIQLLAFPTQVIYVASDSSRGVQALLASAGSILSLSEEAMQRIGQGFWIFAYSATLAWTLVFVGLIVLIGYKFSTGGTQSAFSLNALRSMAMLSATVLFIPFVSVLLQTFECDNGEWVLHNSFHCFAGIHIVNIALVSILLPLFIALSVFMATVFFERDIRSEAINAQVHGRGDAFMLGNKVVLSILFGPVFKHISLWIPQLFLFVSSISYLAIYTVQMPFLNFKINQMKAAFASGFLMASITSFLVLLRPQDDVTLFVVAGIPLACIAGGICCRMIHDAIAAKPANMLRYSTELSIWARKRIAVYEQLKNEYSRLGQFTLQDDEVKQEMANEQHASSGSSSSSAADEDTRYSIPPTEPQLLQLGKDAFEVTNLSSLKEQAEKAYKTMMERFPSNGTILLEISAFFRHYRDNMYMEMRTLNQAKKSCDALDVQFVVYQRLRQMRESSSSSSSNGNNQMNAVDRLLFDQKFSNASKEETTVYKVVYQLWNHLMSPVPQLNRLQKLSEELKKSMQKSDNLYQECLKLNPESIKVLRSYGTFLSRLNGDVEKANECLKKADHIEETIGKQRSAHIDKFRFKRKITEIEGNEENSAVLIVSGDPGRMGEILEASPSACHTLRTSTSDLVGGNVNTIVPRPFNELHNSYMFHFGTTGRGVLMNSTRTMLALDGSRNLIPLILRIHEIPPREDDSSTAPRFSATLKSPQTDENFVMFDNEKNKFRILHADSTSFSRLFGLTGEQVEDEDYLIGDYVPQLKVQTDDDSTASGNNSRGRGLSSSMNKCSSHDIAEKQGADHQAFLNDMLSQPEHTTIQVRRTAEKNLDKVLAKFSKIPVRGYGYVYLLAWKVISTKVRRRRGRSSVNSVDGGWPSEFSPGLCPMRNQESVEKSPRDDVPESKAQSSSRASPPFFSATAKDKSCRTTSLGESANGMDPEEQGVVHQASSLDGFQWAKTRSGKGVSGGGESQGRSSTGSSSSAKRLLHHVTSNGITGVKPVLNKTRIALVICVGLFIIYSAVGWSEMERITLGSIDFMESAKASNEELISYLAVLSSILFAHVPNTPYSGMVNEKAAMWSLLENRVSRYFDASELSSDFADKLGGTTENEEQKKQYEVINRFTGDKETLSTKETRDFAQAHLRQLLRGFNITDFVPGNTPHHGTILFDNTEPVLAAVNSSTFRRIEQFHDVTTSYVRNMEIILFTVLVITVGAIISVLVYYLLRLHRNNRNILKTFLLLPIGEVKRQRSSATKSLKDHIERTSNAELDLDDDSESEDNSAEVADTDQLTGEQSNPTKAVELDAAADDNITNKPPTDSHVKVQPSGLGNGSNRYRHSQLQDFRKYKDSKKFLVFSVLKVLSPLAFLIAWAFSLFGTVQTTFTTLEQETERLEFAELSVGDWIQYQQQLALLSLRTPFPDTNFGNASAAQLQGYRQEAFLNRNMALQRMSIVINGQTEQMGILPLGSFELEIWAGDVCSSLSEQLASRCQDSPLRFGLRPYIRNYLNDGLTVMSKLPPIPRDNDVAMQKLENDAKLQSKFRSFRDAIIPLAEEALQLFADQSIRNAQNTVDTALTSVQVLTAVFVISLAVSIIVITIPAMERVGDALNSAFQLLVLIPEDLLHSHRKLRHQIHDLTENLTAEESSDDAMMILASQGKEKDS